MQTLQPPTVEAIPKSMLLTIVIPVYNEEASLRELVSRVVDVPIRKEVILVDDGSSDNSVAVAQAIVAEFSNDQNDIQLLVQPGNQGKGAAVTTGFKAATGDIVLIQDADLEYDPAEYPRLIKPIVDGKAKVVYGSRFLNQQPSGRRDYWHYVGNRVLTMLSNCFTRLSLTDMETCYKVFSSDVIKEIAPELKQKRFGIEPEITARIARRKIPITELAISYNGRSYAEGKKIGWTDGLSAIWCIIRYGIAN